MHRAASFEEAGESEMKEKDIKLLWGRAGNRCSKCRTELSHDSKAGTGFVLGEHAHIVGEKEGSPRGKSPLSDEERDSYHNRILLCPTDHTEVDKNVEDWPVEKLHHLKSTHELWVQQTLADSADLRMIARRVSIASVIDFSVSLGRLERWKEWTSDALSPDPQWPGDFPDDFDEFRQRVAVAIWSDDVLELACATKTLALRLHEAAQNFLQHAEYRGTRYLPDKFYKRPRPNPTYDRDLEEYKRWLRSGYDHIRDATKAANWFADIVRRDVNPAFFAESGRFAIVDAPFGSTPYGVVIPTYLEEEKMEIIRLDQASVSVIRRGDYS